MSVFTDVLYCALDSVIGLSCCTEFVALQCTVYISMTALIATEGTDFAGLSRTVTLTPTVTQQCVSVMIEDDSVLEETESLTVSLSLTGAQDSVQLSQPTAPIMIVDNDRKHQSVCYMMYIYMYM